MAKKTRKPELRIVFETNILYSGSASDLLNSKTASLIENYSNVSDVKVSWYVPEMVLKERQYQMLSEGVRLLPHVQKLERLLGHNLNITEPILQSRVKDKIDEHVGKFTLKRVNPKLEKIDWNEVQERAVFRRPPFEPGEKEKGFRDYVIGETFLQLVEDSPSTPKSCRVVFVTGDVRLKEYLTEKTQGKPNVKIFSGIEDVKNLINTLASEVQEELIDKIRGKASSYFFEPVGTDSLYHKENVWKQITDKFVTKLVENHPDGDSRENGTRYISPPSFVKKLGQRITWRSRIDVVSKAYKKKSSQGVRGLVPPGFLASLAYETQQKTSTGSTGFGLLESSGTSLGIPAGKTLLTGGESEPVELFAEGRTTFEVTWSILLTTNRKFTKPKIEKLDFIEINWEDKLE